MKKKETMPRLDIFERPVGDIIEYKGVKLRIVKDNNYCFGCYFLGKEVCPGYNQACIGTSRMDGKQVKYKEVKE